MTVEATAKPPGSDPYFMESLSRGLAVIRAFGAGRTRMSGAQVAAATGVSRAAARRCLHTLTVLGYARAVDGGYELTPAVLALGACYAGSTSLASVAQPVLERMTARLQESTGLAILDGDEIVFVARAAARRILSVEVSVGSRLAASCTASGRVLLAYGDEEARARFLVRAQLVRNTPCTLVDRKELRAELERVREQGYALVDQELELGLRSLAVPVTRRDGVILAALNIGVQSARFDAQTMRRELVPVLQAGAKEVGEAL